MIATVDMEIDIDQGMAGCSLLHGKEPFDLSDFSELKGSFSLCESTVQNLTNSMKH